MSQPQLRRRPLRSGAGVGGGGDRRRRHLLQCLRLLPSLPAAPPRCLLQSVKDMPVVQDGPPPGGVSATVGQSGGTGGQRHAWCIGWPPRLMSLAAWAHAKQRCWLGLWHPGCCSSRHRHVVCLRTVPPCRHLPHPPSHPPVAVPLIPLRAPRAQHRALGHHPVRRCVGGGAGQDKAGALLALAAVLAAPPAPVLGAPIPLTLTFSFPDCFPLPHEQRVPP